MTSPVMKLDTLAYAKKLIAAGCEPRLAEAHASVQQETLVEISQDTLSQFATKQDLLMLKQELKQDLKQEMLSVHQEVQTVKQDLTLFKQEVKAGFQSFEQKLESLNIKITVKMGAMLTVAVFVLAAILKLHW